MKTRHAVTVLLAYLLASWPLVAHAAPPAQGDASAACAEGVRLFEDGRREEALPLLQAGFVKGNPADFPDMDDLGECALDLGMVHAQSGRASQSLQAWAVARDAFRASGDSEFEGIALDNMGHAYYAQENYEEALAVFEEALAIRQGAGDFRRQAITLHNIGSVYQAQGLFEEALENFQESVVYSRKAGDGAGEAETLSTVGKLYQEQERYQEAHQEYEEALAIMQAVGAPDDQRVILTMIGELFGDQGLYEEARANFEEARALSREEEDLTGEADILNQLGDLYMRQPNHAQALDYYEQELVIQRGAKDQMGEGRALADIGRVYDMQGRYGEAIAFYGDAIEVLHEAGDRAGESRTIINLGGVHDAQGRYSDAAELHEQALIIAREIGDRLNEGRALHNLGLAYHNQSRYGEALVYYQQAVEIAQETGDRESEGHTIGNMGGVYEAQGRYEEAHAHYEKALAIAREVNDPRAAALQLNNLAGMLAHQEQDTQALDYYLQAVAESRNYGDEPAVGMMLNNIGWIYRRGARYDEALEYFNQALDIAHEVGNLSSKAVVLGNIGEVYRAQGRYEDALTNLQQALEIYHTIGDRAGAGETVKNIALVHLGQGEFQDELVYLNEAMDLFESVRSMAGSELGRASFIGGHTEVYDRAVQLYHEQGQDQEAFYISERGRARAFLDSLATGHVRLNDELSDDLLSREREAYAVLQEAQESLANAEALDRVDVSLVRKLETQMAAAEQEYRHAVAAIEEQRSGLAALIPGRSPVLVVPALQDLLDSQTTLISYYILPEGGGLAFIISQHDLSVVELPQATRENLLTAVAEVREWRNSENNHPLPLRSLYAWLIAPLTEHLRTPTIGIIPHQSLHYVPFAALTDGDRYFGEEYLLFTLPSASALPFIQRNAGAPSHAHGGEALVFGDPLTDDPQLPRLMHARVEAAAVAQLLGATAYAGAEASEEQLRQAAGHAEIVHLASHGVYNSDRPLYSALALASAGTEDGRLEVHEVYGLDLGRSDLVVLSACETSVGELSAGDEVVGLTRAFFFAGTPTVISSLWSVDDAATEKLMVAFYRHWQGGLGKAEALQAAQAEVRAEYPGPFYWAGFVLSGDPGVNTTQVVGRATDSGPAVAASTVTPAVPSVNAVRRVHAVVVGMISLVLLVLTILVYRWEHRSKSSAS